MHYSGCYVAVFREAVLLPLFCRRLIAQVVCPTAQPTGVVTALGPTAAEDFSHAWSCGKVYRCQPEAVGHGPHVLHVATKGVVS
jgi:hypothetical protein